MRSAILSLIISLSLSLATSASAQLASAPSVSRDVTPVILTESQLKRLSSRLCRTLTRFDANELDGTVGDKLEEYLLSSSGIDKENSNYKSQLAHFWNKYSKSIICKANGPRSYPQQHFFNRAIIQNYTNQVLRDYFFFDLDNFPIDPNIATKNQHDEEETLLEYIDRALDHPKADTVFNTERIKKVRPLIKEASDKARARNK